MRLGLRGRLAIALVGTAALAVGIATIVADRGIGDELRDYGAAHRAMAVAHVSNLAAKMYERDGRWSRASVAELDHMTKTNGYALMLYDGRGGTLSAPGVGDSPAAEERAVASVRVGGRSVGRIVLTPLAGAPTEAGLREELRACLREFSLIAALLAVAVALLVAMPAAAPLARPIRRLTEVARRMEKGDLSSRVQGGGGVEIERLGQAFNSLAESLQREHRLRREVAADISHELRTPVTGIVSRIEAAQDGVLPSDGDNLEAMHAEALRLTRLIEDVGHLAEAEQPALLVEKTRLDLAEVAARRAAGYADYFEGKGIEFERTLDSIIVAGDAGRLEQIVDNLLSNALRYTRPGGTVGLNVRRDGRSAVLEVSDTGIGLAVVEELVRAHDGSITVESTPGEGSCFQVRFAARGQVPIPSLR